MYKSQEIRKIAPEMDPLRMGMGWKVELLWKAPTATAIRAAAI